MVRVVDCYEKCVMKCPHLYLELWKSDNNQEGERYQKILFCGLVWTSKRISARLLPVERRRYLGKISMFILKLSCEIWETWTECSAVEEQDAVLLQTLFWIPAFYFLLLWSKVCNLLQELPVQLCIIVSSKKQINKMYQALFWISFTFFFFLIPAQNEF